MTMKDRIAEAIDSTGLSDSAFAKRMGKSKGVVTQWRDGTIKSLKAETAQAMQDITGYRSEWLISGKGQKKVDDPNTIDVPSRWVDEPMAIQAPDASASEFDTGTVHIPYYDTGGAMGHGIVLRDQPGVIREMSVSKEWLQSNVRGYTNAENLCLVTGFGDSMRPLFMSGDPVIVDKGVTEFRGDGLYFFRVDGEGFIKRLQSIPGRGLVVISENPSYEKWSIDGATTDFQVLGKVIKAWCGCDF